MTSNGHVIGGLALGSVLCNLVARSPLIGFRPVCDMVVPIIITPPYAIVAVALFLFGTLLPDCDVDTSAFGRFVHIPLEHRTWMHSLWVPLAMVLVLYVWQGWVWSLWIVFGYVVHLVLDSWSVMGVCWFYPYPGFRGYSGGARVKSSRGHRFFKWYHAGTQEETIVVAALVIIAVIANYAVGVSFGDFSEWILSQA